LQLVTSPAERGCIDTAGIEARFDRARDAHTVVNAHTPAITPVNAHLENGTRSRPALAQQHDVVANRANFLFDKAFQVFVHADRQLFVRLARAEKRIKKCGELPPHSAGNT
jgi:hypothetical protein